jgi:hypothetical protein
MASSNYDEDQLIKHVTERWDELNKALEHVPKFQNKNQTGVSEESIKDFESKLKINLPKEIRAAIKVHDGRKHSGYGLSYRLPTTDLLPLSEWKPYEKEDEDFTESLFESLAEKNDEYPDKNLREDAREHLNAYIEGKKISKDNTLTNNQLFQSLPCELLIIGEGMDDYVEQYLLSIRSGRIYLAIHNIPEWRLIGTFDDWIQEGLTNAEEKKEEMEEEDN